MIEICSKRYEHFALTFYSVIHTQGRVRDPRQWLQAREQLTIILNSKEEENIATSLNGKTVSCRSFISELHAFERTILWPPFFIGVSLFLPTPASFMASSLSKHAFDVFSPRTFNVIRTSKSIIYAWYVNILFVLCVCDVYSVWTLYSLLRANIKF